MKRCYILTVFLSLAWSGAVSQDMRQIDSLKHELEIIKNDTLKLLLFLRISDAFEETIPDSSYYYAQNELKLAKKLKLRLNEGLALNGIAYALKNMGNYPVSLQTYLSANEILADESIEENILPDKYLRLEGFIKKPITTRMKRLQELGNNQLGLSLLYETTNSYDKGLFYGLLAKQSFEEAGDGYNLSMINMILGRIYLSLNKEDSALIFEKAAYDLSIKWDYKGDLAGIMINLGRIHLAMGDRPLATEYFRNAITESQKLGYLRGVVAANLLLFDVYHKEEKKDSSFYFANEALGVAQQLNSPDLLLRTYTALASFYGSSDNNDSTVKYQRLIISIKDSLFNSKQTEQFQSIEFEDHQRRLEMEAEKKAYRIRLQIYSMLIGLLVFLLVAIILWRNNRHKQKAYDLLENQKKETDFQKMKVEQTLQNLQATQAQLIQSEKMASLGQLTAGIAHEIQNPLNFVNNFSEVNEELLSDLIEELSQGKIEDAMEFANDVLENQKKINHHGKRADAIVKGMLEHSKRGTGKIEITDLNALAEEITHLSYNSFLAKTQNFQCDYQFDLDPNLPKLELIPQDIGKALLNLLNNAFYACAERSRSACSSKPTEGEKPTVTVSTKNLDDSIEISVKDNGHGIPDSIKDKIFQPFFTTKPTGKGTGLGLSLSYDIVRAHGGDLKLESEGGKGTTFIISLPIQSALMKLSKQEE